MKTNDQKYLSLTGSPLHEPLWKSFFKTAGMRTGLGFSALSVAADGLTNGGSNFNVLAPLVLTVPAINAFNRMSETTLIDHAFDTNLFRMPFKPSGRPLAIDTQPPAYLRTPDDLMKRAVKARTMAVLMVAAFSGVSMIAIGAAMNNVSVLKEVPVVMAVGAGNIIVPTLATFAACAVRFNKVIKGEHVIVDAPPKQKREDVPQAAGLEPSF